MSLTGPNGITAGSATDGKWKPPTPGRALVAWTRHWRLVTYDPAGSMSARLYLALGPDCLITGYEAVFPVLDREGLNHRHARSPEGLREADGHPAWAGKAVVIDLATGANPERLAGELDGLLAGSGLTGPTYLAGARPLGGQSGLLFLRRESGDTRPDDRRQRLAKLLGE